jgi:hypothetical protein
MIGQRKDRPVLSKDLGLLAFGLGFGDQILITKDLKPKTQDQR